MSSEISDERVVEIMNRSFSNGKNPSISTLSKVNGHRIISFDRTKGELVMVFKGDPMFSNGKIGTTGQVQGGFAGAMLDAATAQMVVVYSKFKFTVAALEQKCTFLQPVPLDCDLYAIAKVIRFGKRIAFMEAELRAESRDGKLLVTSSTTQSLVALPTKAEKKNAKL